MGGLCWAEDIFALPLPLWSYSVPLGHWWVVCAHLSAEDIALTLPFQSYLWVIVGLPALTYQQKTLPSPSPSPSPSPCDPTSGSFCGWPVLTYQQKKWPWPQSTIIDSVSSVELASTAIGNEGNILDGSLTARPHPGDGHHFRLGLLSTNACRELISVKLFVNYKIFLQKVVIESWCIGQLKVIKLMNLRWLPGNLLHRCSLGSSPFLPHKCLLYRPSNFHSWIQSDTCH